jgi:hypothetical protein
MGASHNPCSPKAYFMLVRTTNQEIKQIIRKKLMINKSITRKEQKSEGIFVNR